MAEWPNAYAWKAYVTEMLPGVRIPPSPPIIKFEQEKKYSNINNVNLLKTFFYSLKKSLFESKYYKDVAKVNFWFSFKYLWFLLFILVIFKSIFLGGQYLKSRPQIQPGVNRLLTYTENFYPRGLELKIKNGQLATNVKEPYTFDLEENKWQTDQRHLLIIDTKGSIENYPNYDTYVLATKNAIVYPSKSTSNQIEQTSVFYFRDLKQDFTLNKNVYNNLLNVVRPYTYKVLFFVDYIVVACLFLFLIFGSLFWTGGIMFGLLFLGVSFMLGIFMRLASIGAVVMFAFMYLAVGLPPQNNPFIDDHIVYILVVIVLALNDSGKYLGFGNSWERTSFVASHKVFK